MKHIRKPSQPHLVWSQSQMPTPASTFSSHHQNSSRSFSSFLLRLRLSPSQCLTNLSPTLNFNIYINIYIYIKKKTMRWCFWSFYKCESKLNELWVLLLPSLWFSSLPQISLVFMLATIIVVFLTSVSDVNVCTKI